MTSNTGRLYVIGDRETGVLFVKTEPLRVAIIPKSEIETYATRSSITFDSAFANIAEGAKTLITRLDGNSATADVPEIHAAFNAMIAAGTVISDAEFCLIGEVDNAGWVERRWNSRPIDPAVDILSPSSPPLADRLREAALG